MRASCLVAAFGTAMACSMLGCPKSASTDAADARPLASGIKPAPGGGYCCFASMIPCDPAFVGGWKATPEECPLSPEGNDTLWEQSTDEHGCVFYYPVNVPCTCLWRCEPDAAPDVSVVCTPQPAPDAGGVASCHPDSLNDLPFCADPNCGPIPRHAYICSAGEPGAGGCITFPNSHVFCCEREECARYAETDARCATLGLAYSCPVYNGVPTASGPGMCTPIDPAFGDRQTVCCK